MAKHSYQVSRKEYKCSICGQTINKGEQYVKIWNYYNEYKTHPSCYNKTPKGRWETSEYKGQLLDMNEEWSKTKSVDDLLSTLEDILSSLEDKYDNMPYQLAEGSLVEERKEAVEETISIIEDLQSDLEDIQSELDDLEEPDKDVYIDKEGNLDKYAYEEAVRNYEDTKQELEDKIEDIYNDIENELYNIDI